jgi:hypothetical protein
MSGRRGRFGRRMSIGDQFAKRPVRKSLKQAGPGTGNRNYDTSSLIALFRFVGCIAVFSIVHILQVFGSVRFFPFAFSFYDYTLSQACHLANHSIDKQVGIEAPSVGT